MVLIAGKSINHSLSNNGFTLLEVMISAVILTIGLLGVAGMYVFSSKFSYEARQHTQVISMANEIVDRLKINKPLWIINIPKKQDNQYYELNIVNPFAHTQPTINQSSCMADIPRCYEGLISEQDINGWKQHLSSVFSSSFSLVCIQLIKNENTNLINVELTFNWSSDSDVGINYSEGCNLNYDGIKRYHIETKL